MTKKDRQALAGKTSAELQKQLAEVEQQLKKARIEKHAGKLSNTSLVKTLSDDLARIKTVLRMQELIASVKPAVKKEVEKGVTKVKKSTTKKAKK